MKNGLISGGSESLCAAWSDLGGGPWGQFDAQKQHCGELLQNTIDHQQTRDYVQSLALAIFLQVLRHELPACNRELIIELYSNTRRSRSRGNSNGNRDIAGTILIIDV